MDVDDLGDEAEGMWDMLTDMAENNPVAYHEYLDEQMDIAKKEQQKAASRSRGFRPQRSFCVKTSLVCSARKVFINCCGFRGVEAPMDAAGKSVSGDARVNTSGLSIPIAVGTPRNVVDSDAMAIDAVFNPWVIEQAAQFHSFKLQVVDLALHWCEQETRGKLSRQYKLIKSAYKGFDEEDGSSIESFFQVGAVEAPLSTTKEPYTDSPVAPPAASMIQSPQDLMGALSNSMNDPASIEILPRPESKPKKKALIEEVSAVKKGFLQNTNGVLYGDSGSKEGTPTSIYQKSRIIDLNNMSDEDARLAMEAHGKPKENLTNEKKTKENTPKESNLFSEMMKNVQTQGADEFEKLAELADSELAASSISKEKIADTNDLNSFFAQMSHSLGALGLSPPVSHSNEVFNHTDEIVSQCDLHKDENKIDKTPIAGLIPEYSLKDMENEISVTVSLPLLSSFAQVDVDISENKIVVVSETEYRPLAIVLPRIISKDSARAKFGKKTHKLTIIASTL